MKVLSDLQVDAARLLVAEVLTLWGEALERASTVALMCGEVIRGDLKR